MSQGPPSPCALMLQRWDEEEWNACEVCEVCEDAPEEPPVVGLSVLGKRKRSTCTAFLDNGEPCKNQVRNRGVCWTHGAQPSESKLCKYNVETRCGVTINKKMNRFDGACVGCFKRCNPNDPRSIEANKHAKVKKQSVVEPSVDVLRDVRVLGKRKRRTCTFSDNGQPCKNQVRNGGVCWAHGAQPSESKVCKYNVETRCGVTINKKMNRFDGACVGCFVRYNPNDPRSIEANKHAKVKEQSVVDFVKQHFGYISWTCDRSIRSVFNDNFALVRPDMRALLRSIDIDTHDLILEVDEWRHEAPNYGGCKRENERIGAVWRNVSGGKRPLVVIRINPDDYVDPATGKIVPSCFAYSKAKGKVGVKPSKETEWQQRLEKLRQTIAYWTIEGNKPAQELTTVQLFY